MLQIDIKYMCYCKRSYFHWGKFHDSVIQMLYMYVN